MPGPTFVASSRALFSAVGRTLTLTLPTGVRNGDVVLALVAHHAGDGRGATPTGWTLTDSLGLTTDVLDVYARMIGESEPTSVVFPLATVANEWQGELVAFRGTAPGVVREAAATISFSAATALTTAAVLTQQATNLILSIWTCSGSPVLTVPAGHTPVDAIASAIVAPRSMLVGFRIAGTTGSIAFFNAVASVSTTGRSFSIVVRDRLPVPPAALVDIVPGNIGLIGKDTRPAR